MISPKAELHFTATNVLIRETLFLYAEQSANLVGTLSFLLREYRPRGQSVGSTTITNKSGTWLPAECFVV
jgi:hypothetical protein